MTRATTIMAAIASLAAPLGAQQFIELPAEDRFILADFEEVFRVGTSIGEPWESFSKIVELGFDQTGHLYVFDGVMQAGLPVQLGMLASLRVLVFDAEGGFLREFGRMGEGPGEFSWPNGYVVMRDGTTVVGEIRQSSWQVFDPAGSFERMVRRPEGIQLTVNTQGDPRGGHVLIESAAISTEGRSTRPILRMSLAGDVARADTVAEGWLPESPVLDVARNLGLGSISNPAIFEPELLYGVLPNGGIVFSDSSTYKLKLTAPDAGARVERVIARPIAPQPVTPAIEKAWSEQRAAERLQAEGAGFRSFGQRVDVPFYPELSVIQALAASWEGRIWVHRRNGFPDADGAIDVLTPEGDYVGTLAAAATGFPDAFGPDGLAAFIERDEMDVETVVVRRLPAVVR